jgi:hypothetical protein
VGEGESVEFVFQPLNIAKETPFDAVLVGVLLLPKVAKVATMFPLIVSDWS